MKKIITAINNPKLNEELKKEEQKEIKKVFRIKRKSEDPKKIILRKIIVSWEELVCLMLLMQKN